jgi:hypothetical protein
LGYGDNSSSHGLTVFTLLRRVLSTDRSE